MFLCLGGGMGSGGGLIFNIPIDRWEEALSALRTGMGTDGRSWTSRWTMDRRLRRYLTVLWRGQAVLSEATGEEPQGDEFWTLGRDSNASRRSPMGGECLVGGFLQ